MESQPDKKTPLFDQKLVKVSLVGLFAILIVGVFFTVTRGSDFCIFTIGSCTDARHLAANQPLAVGVGLAAIVGLAVLEIPVAAAVGIGFVVWLVFSSLFN